MWCGIPWPEFSPSFPSGSSWISPASTPAHKTICFSSLQFNSFVLTDLRVLRCRPQEEHRDLRVLRSRTQEEHRTAARKKSRAAAVGAGLRGLCRVQNRCLLRTTTSSSRLLFLHKKMMLHVQQKHAPNSCSIPAVNGRVDCFFFKALGAAGGCEEDDGCEDPVQQKATTTAVRDAAMYLWSFRLF